MIKKLVLSFLVLFFFAGAGAAVASESGPSATAIAIDGDSVQFEVTGDLPSWARKGGYLRAADSEGKLILRGAKITAVEGKVVTVTSSKAAEIKVGETYVVGKGKASAGC
ncbi:hypothetical protein ASA1KI_28000 [Opitutales bacterium ASA1]|uniref:hypothetical protein n=1 Tax=Congregicoccus parvus TaxID=3081749 RepID=UPI002B2DD714|nr:hypothetical protein ASA1KI_28000 [Opitutales bacterium ASA1]